MCCCFWSLSLQTLRPRPSHSEDEEKGTGASDFGPIGPTAAGAKLAACLAELRDLMDKR
jgi:hypothetical protein